MFSNIINKIRTKEDVYRLVDEIELLLVSLYENGPRGFNSTMGFGVRSWVSEILLSEIAKMDNKSPEEYLKSLREVLTGLESVNLTLAFEPSDKTTNKFSSYLQESTGKDVVLDISLDKSILGGVVISYRGIYKDFSIARLFNESSQTIEETIREKMGIRVT